MMHLPTRSEDHRRSDCHKQAGNDNYRLCRNTSNQHFKRSAHCHAMDDFSAHQTQHEKLLLLSLPHRFKF